MLIPVLRRNMVKETKYYDLLGLTNTSATDREIKKVKLHISWWLLCPRTCALVLEQIYLSLLLLF